MASATNACCYKRWCGWTNLVDSQSSVAVAVDLKPLDQKHFRPVSLNFTCRRSGDGIANSMKGIYAAAVTGKAHTLLAQNPNGCHMSQVTGNCGNVRGYLSECRCSTLNRSTHPQLRKIYEDGVIDRVVKLAKEGRTQINIAMFATGGLHGELVLTLRAIEALKSIGYKGTINLFLMDHVYSSAIFKGAQFTQKLFCQKMSSPFAWNSFVGGEKGFEQFLNEIALVLPKTITVNGAFFGSHSDYIARAHSSSNFQHDVLIGADIENTEKEMVELQQVSRTGEEGLVLAKINEKPAFCTVQQELDCTIV